MEEPRAGAGREHPLEGKPLSLSARTSARQVSVAPETPDCVGRVRRRHRTWEGSSTKLMVAEQKEIREREMMAEQMSRGKSSTSITGKLASLLVPALYSRHSSDSGFHSRRGERMKMGDVEFFVTDSRPPSLQVSRSASRAESQGSSIFSSDCLEVAFYSSTYKSASPTFQDEPEPSVRVVPGGDVTESYRLGTLLGEGAFSKVSSCSLEKNLKNKTLLSSGVSSRIPCGARRFGCCQSD